MALDSFAAQNLTFSDGQNNKEAIPEEIVEYGFKPPVRAADGSIQVGDKLAANHLNYLLNDLYSQISDLKARVAVLEGS
ncbi:phosphoglycolate phosphatase [Escherichia coli]|uniref:phosphoglycolate phosphatase n=1 Tax=Escherichia coli TaxID=562 RepID=UPI00111A4EC9|nr:phosphoglycolate phosphatase [Escherichia coli]EEV9286097.1 phosphoglycolate phosphatase [Escherichia coli]EEY5933860.1 phosphoglycolate phosphatase [Escherichia coli]EFM0420423.1 phosphoglycolate phosphatase [Escherichia coli]ELC6182553.1 phosphoglycolate phosphatase [Escherichia coli]ELO4036808.1 phosphoglycolate phosphatase [Escherichia coli]